MPISALSHLGISKETTYGTAAAATMWIPVKDLKPADEIKYYLDEGKRGYAVKDFGAYQGTRMGQIEYAGDVYPDVIGHLLLAIFGKDTVTGAASPYTHTFQVGNVPPSYTFSDYNGVTERQWAGARLSEMGFKFATDTGGLEFTLKGASKASVTTAVTTPSFGTVNPFLGWQAAMTIGGTAVPGRLLAFEFSVKRALKEVFAANNSQDVSNIYSGVMEVTGKITTDFPDENELNHFLNNDQPALTVTLSQNANTSIKFQLSKVAFEKATPDRSQEFVRLDSDLRGLYNTTDAGPAAVVLTNAVATY